MSYFQKLSIRRTYPEWELIEKVVANLGKDDLGHYLRIELSEFIKKYQNNPSIITVASGERIEKRPCIFKNQFEDLHIISSEINMPVSTIVDRFIIEKLLRD